MEDQIIEDYKVVVTKDVELRESINGKLIKKIRKAKEKTIMNMRTKYINTYRVSPIMKLLSKFRKKDTKFRPTVKEEEQI